ncbi:hypothetical protein HAX54_006842 [Datura stramonium]|uniref:Uncharacterized protein n=1 Tax=Datura stramonium TaxID=4076 RepID=A0ABS8WUD4_DATST|nr:hypothetical protein [Datura stramonium]
MTSSNHGTKRARRISEEEHEDVRMAPQPLRRYWLRWATEQEVLGKHVTHVTRKRVCIVNVLMTGMPINVGVIIKNVLKRERVKKDQSFGFEGLLTRFLRGHDIEEEEADYRPVYDPRGIDVTETKEPEGINGPVLSVNKHNTQIDNMLSHLYGMKMLQLRMNGVTEEKLQQLNMDYPLREHSRDLCRVGPGFEDLLDDDVAKEDEMARVYSDVESSDDKEDDSEMGLKVMDLGVFEAIGMKALQCDQRRETPALQCDKRREAPALLHDAWCDATLKQRNK